MSDLRTRITTAIWDELDRQRVLGFGPFVDRKNGVIDTTGTDGVDMEAVADAVIRELGIRDVRITNASGDSWMAREINQPEWKGRR